MSTYGPVKLNVPVAGSYSSGWAAIAQQSVSPFVPPVIRTFPFVSAVAVNPCWLETMLPVAVKLPVSGS
jgi:hypothetical protein